MYSIIASIVVVIVGFLLMGIGSHFIGADPSVTAQDTGRAFIIGGIIVGIVGAIGVFVASKNG